MDIVIYRDVGGFPVWFGLRSCFFCVTCCFWLHQAWPSRRTVVVFRLRWELPPPSVTLLDFSCRKVEWLLHIRTELPQMKALKVWRVEQDMGVVSKWVRSWMQVSFKGCLSSPWEMGWGVRPFRRNSEYSCCSSTLKAMLVQVSEDDASLMPPGWDVSGMSHQEGRYTGEILSFGWVGNTSCPCRRS